MGLVPGGPGRQGGRWSAALLARHARVRQPGMGACLGRGLGFSAITRPALTYLGVGVQSLLWQAMRTLLGFIAIF